MGNGHRDPTDHFRTTLSHAGEWMNDGFYLPGLTAIAAGVAGLISCVAVAAYQRHEWLLQTGLVAVLALGLGGAWCAFEHRRVCRIESRWQAEHSAEAEHLEQRG